MTNDTKNSIKMLLIGVTKKAETCSSIEEKRAFYHKYLERNIDFIDIDEDIDLNSPEIDELITDNFLSIKSTKPQVFEAEGFVPWLDDHRKDIAWSFYNRYEEYLLKLKGWKPKAVTSIKQSSDIILDHMANPKSDKLFNKQGLVIGDIQSGKTANYTAVINKAIDAGYKIIIVLAGMTRDLRNQTQKRLDSEVLGYETKNKGKGKALGVGTIKQLNIEGLTYSDEEKDYGDMKKFFSTHTLDDKLNPIVAIVKKNKSVLQHLHKFLTSSQSYCYTNDKLDIPVLIIDDEVDQASVDTKDSETIEGASAINRMIRTILDCLNRYSYVGYTATPFANVFVNPDREDIYPKDFILNIPSNEDYCGVEEYFGVDIITDEEYTSDHVKDLVVNINDYGDLFSGSAKINAQTITEGLNNSIKDAIKSFILAASIKKARGFDKHNSMLIHIARFKNPATTLRPLVNSYLNELYHKLKYEYQESISIFKDLWEDKFKGTSKKRLAEKFNDSWDKIEEYLLPTLESAMKNVKVINGDSGDVLDYSIAASGDYIVIGGDKLSRGLTLEGLVVSYYYRNSKMYDSLLQMGRWFGYRKGWIDVCRVFTTVRFMNDFITVGKVLQKFKSDVADMYSQNLNPREVGQRIMFSPNLIPTARNKMKSTTKVKVSFSGEVQQVISFDRRFVEHNYSLTENFISGLGKAKQRSNNKVVFKNVKVDKILDYLREYKECGSYYGYGHISIVNWINYIENLVKLGELNCWTVILSSLQSEKDGNGIDFAGYKIYKPSRTLRDIEKHERLEYYTIKVNSSPKDFVEFFDPDSKEYKTVDHYEPSKTYPGFDANHAIMSIYVSDLYEKEFTGEYDPKTNKEKAKRGKLIPDGINVCAPAIWFPKTNNYEESATTYYVSNDYLRREAKQEEDDIIEFGEGTTNE